jgi:hypothetical protein
MSIDVMNVKLSCSSSLRLEAPAQVAAPGAPARETVARA